MDIFHWAHIDCEDRYHVMQELYYSFLDKTMSTNLCMINVQIPIEKMGIGGVCNIKGQMLFLFVYRK
jgi:hypothetical protein